MSVRRVGKFTIAVGGVTYKETIDAMNALVKELKTLGIKCKLYLKRRLIVTRNIIIKFIFKKHHYGYNRNIYGVKCNGCYGFDDVETYNITGGKNKCKGYKLIDYIKERDDK